MKPNLRGAGIHIVYKKEFSEAWHVLNAVGWDDPTQTISRRHTKMEATKIGRALAQKNKVELYIHGRDGKIKRRDSYGKESKKKDKR